ncbi:MAG: hypothetical protein ABSH45_02495 [Bryobacteraceae bacterium]|jgi:hypothetical protein
MVIKPALLAAFAALLLSGPAAAFDDLDATLQSLKDAQSKNDIAAVKKLATEVYAIAGKTIAEPEPKAADEKADWAKQVAYARSVTEDAAYAVLAVASQAQPADAVDLMALLESLNPKSQYLDQGYERYFYALRQLKQDAKIVPLAEKAVPNFPNNPDLLAVLADSALAKNQADRALGFARRLIAAFQRTKPEWQSAADWERRKGALLGAGYYIAGVVAGAQGLYLESNTDLRAALPLIKGNQAMMGPALFYLGLDNYQLGKMTNNKKQLLEGANFSQQAAQVPGTFQQQAYHNYLTIKNEADRMR